MRDKHVHDQLMMLVENCENGQLETAIKRLALCLARLNEDEEAEAALYGPVPPMDVTMRRTSWLRHHREVSA